MRNQVSFRTGLFENKEAKSHFINPRCFGEDLVSWLLQRLQGTEFSLGEPIQEDYGWGFWVNDAYWVAVGVMVDSIGVEEPEWCVSVNLEGGLKNRLFVKSNPSLDMQIFEALNTGLEKSPQITSILMCNGETRDWG